MPRAQGLAPSMHPRVTALFGALVALAVLLTTQSGVVAAAPPAEAPHIQVVSPTGGDTYGKGHYLRVIWRATWVDSGEFGLWVESPAGSRYVETIEEPRGTDLRTTYMTLNVPAGTGYRVYVAWRPVRGSGLWLEATPSPGSFAVTDVPDGTPIITITVPAGTETFVQGSKLPMSWTTRARVRSGEFSAWVQSPDGVRSSVTIVAANGGSSYDAVLPVTMPIGDGYRAYVAWRSARGSGDWYGTVASPGSFSVVADEPTDAPRIMVTAPAGTATYAVGSMLTVRWTTSRAVSDGEFGVWVDRGTGIAFLLTSVAPDGGADYSTTLRLDLPTGSGYRVVVGWRPVSAGDWTSADKSAGSFTVKGTPGSGTAILSYSFQGLSPAAIAQIYAPGRQITVIVPVGTDVRALVATFTTTGATVKVGGMLQVSGTTPNDFTNRVQYTVTSSLGAKQNWSVLVRTAGPRIGQEYGGGIVAYVLQPGDPGYVPGETHGLIAAVSDQGGRVPWAMAGEAGRPVPGGTGTALGTGRANTDGIVAQNGAGTGYAAGVARAYRGGGYSDWYLPSKDELSKLAANQALIGGFVVSSPTDWGAYWSSSEASGSLAWQEVVSRRIQEARDKAGRSVDGPAHVRPVRWF